MPTNVTYLIGLHQVVYRECQVILFAVKTKVENSDRYEILLNPRHYYVIKEHDLCVYMAESTQEVRDIKKMVKYDSYPYVEKVLINHLLFKHGTRTLCMLGKPYMPCATLVQLDPIHQRRYSARTCFNPL
jgi:hypothetical protein